MNPRVIGTVRSHLVSREQCPKYGDASMPPVWIELAPDFEPAATDLQVGDSILVLTWMHQGDQSVLRCHPQGNRELPMRGIFSTRSPDRPTPIGLHAVRILGREGLRLKVHPLEVIDGTPVIDIKPDNTPCPAQTEFSSLVNPDTGQAILTAGRDGWQRGLFAGFNGNVSIRQGERVVITATGSAKGHLSPKDLAVVDLSTGTPVSSVRASSEIAVHLEVYRNQPRAKAIVHTHPPKLLALSLRGEGPLLDLPLFEGRVFADKLTRVPAHRPGTVELAQAVGQASRDFEAVFMDNHGLVCWGDSMIQALGLSEELESLAGIAMTR
ncbi:TrmO family methyltransferase domain-containing protein [Desulfomicrobium baculatum]|uniref:Class II aldolase/adducin family protein n=1 Tax=Desulfomicrobium baculatum (strain DSM 4028 / VKM B-1378 / X) TaxID=525897 RepID=C7LRP3_DESBD|nr:TrmO family methyltransferase [Desulfomicrobium baculatum]ACU90551.1 class II aldolase/adducin family protein [Desulfomicrobium baculatum DSM 4028]